MSQSVRIATAVAATATVLAGSYALYFDYQRRHNPDFRRQIRMSLDLIQISRKRLINRIAKEESSGSGRG
jgi:import receptor subunit TOM20